MAKVRAKKPIERAPDLRSQVYDRLRARLRRGDLPAKGRLNEHAVARDYGVSRTPAREAIALLVRDGLLVQQGRGFTIPAPSIADIFDVFEVRLCLEPQAMRHLSRKLTANQAQIVQGLLDRDFAEDRPLDDYVAVQTKARKALFAMVDNARLVQAIELYEDHVLFVRERTLVLPAAQRVSRTEMRVVLHALLARDAAAAASGMTALLVAARDDIVAVLENEKGGSGE